jgi:uroporphyrin-III C-methyltransferase/precorrin-2 dehydrogenase/sirohydrochlorin ferrochelatase
MKFLPVFLDMSAGTVMLVGSSPAARAKLRLLRVAGAHVRWFPGDDGAEEAASGAGGGTVDIDRSDPEEADLTGVIAVISASGDRDAGIAARARAHGVPVNVVDRPELSTFIVPAIADRGDVVVAIGTGRASPVLARRLREKIEAMLPARIGHFAALMQRYRKPFAERRHPSVSLRAFWEHVVDGPIGQVFLAGRTEEAEAALARAVEESRHPAPKAQGIVHLVGAGPGDPDLLTLRALHLLQSADVIFHDDLVAPEILSLARRDADLHRVGKRKGAPGIGQDEIHRRMAEAAKAGHCVVRLKGGDPFVFGRGGEEMDYLQRAGVEVAVVPGITAALGCAAEAGLPLTFRREATRLTFVTANTAEGAQGIDWSSLGDRRTTVVVYMGLSSASHVRDGLLAAGRAPETPAAVLARGTRADARSIVGRLQDLPALAARAGEGPAILLIGNVVARSRPWQAAMRATADAA